MKITYETNLEDIVKFNLYHHYVNSSYSKRTILWCRLSGSLLVIIVTGALAYLYYSIQWLYYGLLAASIYFFIFPLIFKRSLQTQVRRMYSEGKNIGIIGKHELETTPDVLISRSNQGESKIKWESIEKIAKTKDYIYIYLSSVGACIIPLNSVIEGNAGEFLNHLETIIKNKTV